MIRHYFVTLNKGDAVNPIVNTVLPHDILRIGFGNSREWIGKDSLPKNMGTTDISSP